LGNQIVFKLYKNFAPHFGNRKKEPHSATTSPTVHQGLAHCVPQKPSGWPLSHLIAISYTLTSLTSILLAFLTLKMTAVRRFDTSETIYPTTHCFQTTGFE